MLLESRSFNGKNYKIGNSFFFNQIVCINKPSSVYKQALRIFVKWYVICHWLLFVYLFTLENPIINHFPLPCEVPIKLWKAMSNLSEYEKEGIIDFLRCQSTTELVLSLASVISNNAFKCSNESGMNWPTLFYLNIMRAQIKYKYFWVLLTNKRGNAPLLTALL